MRGDGGKGAQRLYEDCRVRSARHNRNANGMVLRRIPSSLTWGNAGTATPLSVNAGAFALAPSVG